MPPTLGACGHLMSPSLASQLLPRGLPFCLASNNPDSSLRLIAGDFYAVGQLGHPFSTYQLMTYLPFRFRAFRAA